MSRLRFALVSSALSLAVLSIALGCGEGPSAAPAAGQRPADAPWINQADGAPRIDDVALWPSLRFPSGVTYAEALEQLFVSVEETGELPASATVAPPLPDEVVLVRSSDPASGLRLSMSAPWGWTPEGRLIRAPSLNLPGTLAPDEVDQRFAKAEAAGRALPEGAHVDVPRLEPCQIALDSPGNRPPCS